MAINWLRWLDLKLKKLNMKRHPWRLLALSLELLLDANSCPMALSRAKVFYYFSKLKTPDNHINIILSPRPKLRLSSFYLCPHPFFITIKKMVIYQKKKMHIFSCAQPINVFLLYTVRKRFCR